MIMSERMPLVALLELCIAALAAPHSHAGSADDVAREGSNPAN
jgi:hypothetical protein